jgi:hypothetical protein
MAVTTYYPSAHSDTYVKATGQLNMDCYAYYATDPALSLTGFAQPTVSWISSYGDVTNQKFNVDLGSAQIINTLAIDNYHDAGSSTNIGIENFSIYGTNDATAFSNTTYSNTDDLVLLDTLQAVAHSAFDASDTQTITFSNSNAYRYYVLRIADNLGSSDYMGIRHIEFQYDDTLNVPEMSGGIVAGGTALVGWALASTAGAIAGGSSSWSKGSVKLTSGGAVAGKELTGGAVVGGSAGVIRSYISIAGALGFVGNIEVNQWLNEIKGAIGFSGDFTAYREGLLSSRGSIGFAGLVEIDQPMAMQLVGAIGFDGSIDITQDETISMSGGIGFDGTINVVNQNLLEISGAIGFGSIISASVEGSNLYVLPVHNSLRWT